MKQEFLSFVVNAIVKNKNSKLKSKIEEAPGKKENKKEKTRPCQLIATEVWYNHLRSPYLGF